MHSRVNPSVRWRVQGKNLLDDIVIRIAKPGDRPRVINVIDTVAGERCFLQTDRYIPTDEWEKMLNDGMNMQDGHLLLVVEIKGQIVGFARLIHVMDNDNGCIIGNVGIVIMPAYRSQKIGTVLLKEVIRFSRRFGYQILTADILATNIRSLRLFTRFGFVVHDKHTIFMPFLNTEIDEITVAMRTSARDGTYADLSNQQ